MHEACPLLLSNFGNEQIIHEDTTRYELNKKFPDYSMFIASFARVTEDAEFCVETFLPEIESATESIELSEAEREELLGAMLGTAVKLLYAFLWQVRLSMSQRSMKTVNDFLL